MSQWEGASVFCWSSLLLGQVREQTEAKEEAGLESAFILIAILSLKKKEKRFDSLITVFFGFSYTKKICNEALSNIFQLLRSQWTPVSDWYSGVASVFSINSSMNVESWALSSKPWLPNTNTECWVLSTEYWVPSKPTQDPEITGLPEEGKWSINGSCQLFQGYQCWERLCNFLYIQKIFWIYFISFIAHGILNLSIVSWIYFNLWSIPKRVLGFGGAPSIFLSQRKRQSLPT